MSDVAISIKGTKEIIYSDNLILKKGIWLYFFLLLFEGALRKWVLPSLSAPLLIVRDRFYGDVIVSHNIFSGTW